MLKCTRCKSMNIRSITTTLKTNQRDETIFYHECCDCGHKNAKCFKQKYDLDEVFDEIEDIGGLRYVDVINMLEEVGNGENRDL